MQLDADDIGESIALPGEDYEPLEDRLYEALANSATVLRGHIANYVRLDLDERITRFAGALALLGPHAPPCLTPPLASRPSLLAACLAAAQPCCTDAGSQHQPAGGRLGAERHRGRLGHARG